VAVNRRAVLQIDRRADRVRCRKTAGLSDVQAFPATCPTAMVEALSLWMPHFALHPSLEWWRHRAHAMLPTGRNGRGTRPSQGKVANLGLSIVKSRSVPDFARPSAKQNSQISGARGRCRWMARYTRHQISYTPAAARNRASIRTRVRRPKVRERAPGDDPG
jgi:hypothetical protein